MPVGPLLENFASGEIACANFFACWYSTFPGQRWLVPGLTLTSISAGPLWASARSITVRTSPGRGPEPSSMPSHHVPGGDP
jgi:hypothetical protein